MDVMREGCYGELLLPVECQISLAEGVVGQPAVILTSSHSDNIAYVIKTVEADIYMCLLKHPKRNGV